MWTPERERMLGQWLADAELARLMHDRSAQSFALWLKVLDMPSIVLQTFTTSSLLSVLQTESLDSSLKYVTVAASFLSTVTRACVQYLDWASRVKEHEASKDKYALLVVDIQRVLSSPAEERGDAAAYMQQTSQTMKELYESAPSIPDRILNEYGRSIASEAQRLWPIAPADGPIASDSPPAVHRAIHIGLGQLR